MKQVTITVVSNNPAGGRCTLYANYAQELSAALGFSIRTLYPDDGHQFDAPGLLINGSLIMPNDGVIIDADDICHCIEQAGIKTDDLGEVRSRLDDHFEEMMAGI